MSSNVKVRVTSNNHALMGYVVSAAIAVSAKAFVRKCRLVCQTVVSPGSKSQVIKRFYGLIAMERNDLSIISHASFLDYLLRYPTAMCVWNGEKHATTRQWSALTRSWGFSTGIKALFCRLKHKWLLYLPPGLTLKYHDTFPCAYITNTNPVTMFNEIIAIYSEYHKKHITTLRVKCRDFYFINGCILLF